MRSRLVLGVGLTLALCPGASAIAAPTSGTVTAKPAAEGWYRTTPACALPTSCVDATGAPSPYPADTLHVGVAAGQEESRTYLRLDLTQLPPGTKPTGGTLLLPLAAASDGTLQPETATLQACAVDGSVTDVDGTFEKPPTADCATSTKALSVPAAGDNPAAFTVDLGALASSWESGTPGAIALVPQAETPAALPAPAPPAPVPAPPAASSATWHLAFHGRTRTGTGVVPISAAVSYVSATVDTDEEEPPFVPAPDFEPAPAAPQQPPPFASPGLGSPPGGQPQPLVTVPRSPVTGTPVASAVPTGFKYPGIFLFPLGLLIGVGYLGRALTRDLAAT